MPISFQNVLQIVSFIKALYGLIFKISVYMDKNREVFMRILKGITKMLKRIKSLRGMETKQKCVVQRDEIIIPLHQK